MNAIQEPYQTGTFTTLDIPLEVIKFDYLDHLDLFKTSPASHWLRVSSYEALASTVPELVPEKVVRMSPAGAFVPEDELRLSCIHAKVGMSISQPVGCQITDHNGTLLHTIVVDSSFFIVSVEITPLRGEIPRADMKRQFSVEIQCRHADTVDPKVMFAWLCQRLNLQKDRHLFVIDRTTLPPKEI